MNTIFDPRGNPTSLVDGMIGQSYPIVRFVATNMEYVKHVSYYLPNLHSIFDNMDAVINASNLADTLVDAKDIILAFSESFGTVQDVLDQTAADVASTAANLVISDQKLADFTTLFNNSTTTFNTNVTNSTTAINNAGTAALNNLNTALTNANSDIATAVADGIETLEDLTDAISIPNSALQNDSVDSRTINAADRLNIIKKLALHSHTPDAVMKLLASIAVRGMYIRKISTNIICVGIGMSLDYKSVVEYRFLLNGDNMFLFRGCFAGVEDDTLQTVQPTLVGTFNTASTSSYTTVVNDTFTGAFIGSEFLFDSPTDNRGGIWEFTLSNGEVKRVSTWSSTLLFRRIMVFKDLIHDSYTFSAKFLGADPLNPPSGGTARGWLTYSAGSAAFRAVHISSVKPPTIAAEDIVSANSVSDFAMAVRPNGAAYSTEWVPQHSTVNNVCTAVNFKLIVDGKTLSSVAGSVGTLAEQRSCECVELVHSFEARNPNGSDGAMWNQVLAETIKKNSPYVAIRGVIDVLIDTYVSSGYGPMLVSDFNHVSRLALNNGAVIDPIPTVDTQQTFGFDVNGAIFSGEYAAPPTTGNYHAVAIRQSSLMEAVSYGKRTQPTTPGLLDYRLSGIVKAYWKMFDNTILYAGERYTFGADILAATGIRFPHTKVKAI